LRTSAASGPQTIHGIDLAAAVIAFILRHRPGRRDHVVTFPSLAAQMRGLANAKLLAAAGSANTGPPIVLAASQKNPKGPPPQRLPASSGHWIGTPGNGTWIPTKPLVLENGIKIDRVPYRDGMPVFDKWSKGEVTIAITGQNRFDRVQAIRAWYANGGGKLPDGYVFHHDGLTTQSIKYKGKDIFVGQMQLVPEDLNGKIPHIGSSSVARRVASKDKKLARTLANELNESGLKGKGPLKKIAKRFKSLLAKGAKKLGRIIPLIGGALVILDFTENVEAHGLGGALVRGTPLLGDIVTAYDVGSDFADEIKADADRKAQGELERINATSHQASRAAAAITAKAFENIAKRVRVTNPYFDAGSLKKPIEDFYETIRPLIRLRLEGKPIAYPDGTYTNKDATDSAYKVKLRWAIEQLETDIRQQTEQPEDGRQRANAT
jgi:HNH/ENDO VII superfamily nuclease